MLRYLKEKRRYVFSSNKSYTQIYHYLCTLIGKKTVDHVGRPIDQFKLYMDTEKVGSGVLYSGIMVIEVFKCFHTASRILGMSNPYL